MNLSVRDAAGLLNVAEKTIYRWIKQGVIPAYQINDQYRFNRAELLEWATSRKISVSPEIFAEPEGGEAPPPSLSEALRAGGVHYRVGGMDKASVLHAVVDMMKLPEEVDREFLARSRGDPSTVSSFTNGADPVPEPFDPGAANGVLCVGTWIPEKGSKVLPRIWSLLRAQEPSVKLTVAGTGVSADAVRQSFSPQDRHTVEVVPEFRGSTELEPLLRDAAVFLLPSLREGSPLALLEAMSHGLPIVASTVGGVPDVVRDGTDGFLYSALETGRAAELVHRLLGSVDLRRRLGSAARARADSLTCDRATSAVERACQLASEVVH